MACVYLLEDLNKFGYIGSTCNLYKRLYRHNSKNNDCKSKYLTKPFECLVLEEIDDEDNLEFAEQFYIKLYKDLYGDKLLNIAIPLRTDKEYRNDNKDKLDEAKKEYRNNNREKIKEYYIENKDRVLHRCKIYRDENKSKIKTRDKIYYNKNKDKILERQSKIIECECGTIFTSNNKTRHLKSKKHQNFLDA